MPTYVSKLPFEFHCVQYTGNNLEELQFAFPYVTIKERNGLLRIVTDGYVLNLGPKGWLIDAKYICIFSLDNATFEAEFVLQG